MVGQILPGGQLKSSRRARQNHNKNYGERIQDLEDPVLIREVALPQKNKPPHPLSSNNRRSSDNFVIVLPKKWVALTFAAILGWSMAIMVLQQGGMSDQAFSLLTLPFEQQEGRLLSTNEDLYHNHRSNHTANHPSKKHRKFPDIQEDTKLIFYHIFVPTNNTDNATANYEADANETDPSNALRIVEEQLQQLGDRGVTLLYNLVGATHVPTDDGSGNVPVAQLIHEWCQEYKFEACHALGHYHNAMEEVTLQATYDYCQAHPDTKRVGYVHNKGSYHPSVTNDAWRYQMTQALAREECWSDSHHCNVCGLYFTTDRGMFMAGNVWTADCSYINQLIEPSHFEQRSTEVAMDSLLKLVKGYFRRTQYVYSESFLGMGRYAAEWWIGSHPTIRPCDFSLSLSTEVRYDRTKQFLDRVGETINMTDASKNTVFTTFTPGAPGLSHIMPRPRYFKVKKRFTHDGLERMKREIYLLAGKIHRWLYLYNELPDENSWCWKHYPQGDFWKEVVKQYGKDVLDKVLLPIPEPN